MITLALDTSTIKSSMALFSDEKLIESLEHHSQKLQTGLFKLIERTFNDYGIEPIDIKRVIVGIGPGSFTGVRIGVAFAKTFCQLTNAELIPLESYFLGMNNFEINTHYIPVIPSTRSECYACLFKIESENIIRSIKAIDDGSPERVINWVKDVPINQKVIFYGEGVSMLNNLEFPDGVHIEVKYPEESLPNAGRALTFINKHSEKNKSVDPMVLKPLYVRPSPAEIAVQRRSKL